MVLETRELKDRGRGGSGRTPTDKKVEDLTAKVAYVRDLQ
jgi:hypothetical protein